MVWEVPAGREVVAAQLHTPGVTALAWSPDGRRVASGSINDRTVRVWDPDRGEELLRFDVPGGAVPQVQWSPDGRRLAAACADGSIQVWDASAGYQFLRSEAYVRGQAREESKEADKLWDQGRRAEAMALLGQSLEKRRAALGPDHDDTLRIMANLERYYRTAGRIPEAIALDQELLERRKAKHGPDHDDTVEVMHTLALTYLDAGQFDRAEPLLAELLEHARKTKGPEPLEIAERLAELGLNRLKRQGYAEAEPLLRECLAIRTDELPDHWLRFNAQSLLGDALLGQAKYAEAEPLLRQGYAEMKQRETTIPPAAKKRLTEAAERLVRLYEATGRADEAKAWREKLAAHR
jgi:hypothetical protein